MFGHQVADQDNSQAVPQEPVPDVAAAQVVSADNTALNIPAPVTDPPSAPAVSGDTASDFSIPDQPQPVGPPTHDSAVPGSATNTIADDELLSLKQQALQQLSPLVGHLDQTPEEKFRTTMMMIQAADNQALLKAAYEAAQAIPDEKARAQALLDVVNEINYFTQPHDQ